VPSDRRIFKISVRENLQLAAAGAADWEERVNQALTYFPLLASRMDQRATTLSGGEQQALAIARATVMGARYLLLDEPSEGLAPVLVESLIDGIRELQSEMHVGILIAERNMPIVQALCTEVVGLVKGRVVHSGPMSEFSANSELQERLLTVASSASF
jgi:branched-chain amino acid transport system ATP-binding protein